MDINETINEMIQIGRENFDYDTFYMRHIGCCLIQG